MHSRRHWGLLALLFGLLGIGMHTMVQADDLRQGVLQDVPRLDGMNIYFTEANREASRFDRTDTGISHFAGLLGQLGANLFTLDWRADFPTNADLIVIVAPLTDFSQDQIAKLWVYENHAGSILLLADTLTEGARTRTLNTAGGLVSLLWADIGLRLRDDVIVTQRPDNTLETVFTATRITPDTPITATLNGELAFFTARSLEIDASPQTYEVTPLIFTDDQFYGESDFATYQTNGTYVFNINFDTTQGAIPLAASFNNDRTGVRGVVIGDGQFATNGAGMKTSPNFSNGYLYPNNARFLINAVSWLLERPVIDLQFSTPAPTGTATTVPTITPTFTPSPVPTATATAAS